jgi:tetratricopeptide (TPR) repeat protein
MPHETERLTLCGETRKQRMLRSSTNGSGVPRLTAPLVLVLLGLGLNQPVRARAPAPQHQTSTEAHVGKGYEYEKDDRFALAAVEFEAALTLDPKLTRVRYQLGVCYYALGRNDDAKREFERLRADTHDDPSVIYFLGRLDLTEHNFDAAIRELQSIVAQPPFPDAAYYLGSVYLEKGDLTDAEKWLKTAEPLNPRDFRVPDHLARVYQREGRPSDAEKEYVRSAELRHNYDAAAAEGIACSQELAKAAPDEATENCERLFRPDDPDRLTQLGMIYGERGRYAQALGPLERAAKLDPDSYEIEHNLGLTYFRLKRYAEARGPLERAVALRPDFFDSNVLLGGTLFMLGQDSEAYRVLDHAHRLNPEDHDSAELLFKTAMILAAKNRANKQYPEALKYLRTAEGLRPEDPGVHARLAELYESMGDPQQAQLERQSATAPH